MNFIPKLRETGLIRNLVRGDAVNHDVVGIEKHLGGTNQPRATLDDPSCMNHDEAKSAGASAISISSFKIDSSPVHVSAPQSKMVFISMSTAGSRRRQPSEAIPFDHRRVASPICAGRC